MFDEKRFQETLEEFKINNDELRKVALTVKEDLKIGLRDSSMSSMRMLKSYLGLPSGNETGEYLALDFGGTNIRVFKIRLNGEGKFEILKQVRRPLVIKGEYNYINKDSTAEQLFDFIASIVDETIDRDRKNKFYLGHTFSFPSTQNNIYNAKLIVWTKEFATQGVEGEIVNDLLFRALRRRGIVNVEPVAVINDTVAVLLSAAYKNPDTFISSIYATGHNTCYLESSINSPKGIGTGGMILNLESGGFMKLTPNRFDVEYDNCSEKPNEQRFEKMVSGRYMGELFSATIAYLLGEQGKNYGLTSIDISMLLLNVSPGLDKAKQILEDKVGCKLSTKDIEKVYELAAAIVTRSARLIAASYVGIIWHRTGENKIQKQHIAIDGSVYEKMPLVRDVIANALNDLIGEDASQVDIVLDNGGSGLGAALAAAMTVNQSHSI